MVNQSSFWNLGMMFIYIIYIFVRFVDGFLLY